MKIVTEIHFETEEERDIFMSANRLHNSLKTYIHRLEQFAKYEEDERAKYELNQLYDILKQNNIENIL